MDRTLALGPAANRPVFTIPGGSNLVLRIDVAAQPEYGSRISIVLAKPQPSTSNATVVITATKEYFGGTPSTWSLPFPDLTDVSGFFPLWTLSPNGNGWSLSVTGLPFDFSPASPRDGDAYRSASASGPPLT
jgi:hypothetical protein